MKKILFVLIAAFGMTAAIAQKTFTPDTLTNTDTAVFQFQTGNFSTNNVYALYVKTTEISGTPTIAVAVQHRVGAGDWVTISSDTIATAGSPNSAAIIKTAVDTPATNYRVVVFSTGTGVSRLESIQAFRRK
jgi:hypothetical protein